MVSELHNRNIEDFCNYLGGKNLPSTAEKVKELARTLGPVIVQQSALEYETKFIRTILDSPLRKLIEEIAWELYQADIRFVANIAYGVGHTVCEYDYFLRKKKLGDIPQHHSYVLLRRPCHYSQTYLSYFGQELDFWSCNLELYQVLLPLTVYFSEITVNAGLSRLRWQLARAKELPPQEFENDNFLVQTDNLTSARLWEDYFRVRLRTYDYWPLKPRPEQVKLKKGNRPLALLHYKLNNCNAIGAAVPPESYHSCIEYLKSKNYELVLVGREPLPSSWARLGVQNYPESGLASVENDLQLFHLADFSFICGSGIGYVPDVMQKPFLYVHFWHIARPFPNHNVVCVPSRVRRQSSGKLLPFREQMLLYSDAPNIGAERFQASEHEIVPPSAEEMLQGMKELLRGEQNGWGELSPLQKAYKDIYFQPGLYEDALLHFSQARFAEQFLENSREQIRESQVLKDSKHRELLEDFLSSGNLV